MLTFTERQVAWYLARCPVWRGQVICSIRRACSVTGCCRSEVTQALAKLVAIMGLDVAAE